mgnify:FL=1
MSYIVVDVEADSPSPANGSMVCFGAVLVKDVNTYFYGQTKPITDTWNPEALKISGFTREEHEGFNDPFVVMTEFDKWIKRVSEGNPIFITDNPAFDWQWINYYFHKYLKKNPFVYSARRIGDLYCGYYNNPYYIWKKHRDNKKFPHNHNPISDACGNATALHYLISQGFNLKLK